ncbi:MAG: hypothetical protein ACJ76V_00270 [Thermoleophilaceae bacterium]
MPVLGLIAAVAVAILAAPASAVPAVGCGKVRVGHHHYSVRAHVLACSKARPWAVTYLKRHGAPRGYQCRRFPRALTRVVFLCDNPKTRSRSDGPQSFSASR